MSTLVTDKDVTDLCNLLSEVPRGVGAPIACDCETTGLHPYAGDTLRGFSIAFLDPNHDDPASQPPILSYYLPVAYPTGGNLMPSSVQRICQHIREIDPTYVYHHAKFDLRFLRQLPKASDGAAFFPVPPVGRFWDTKIAAWLIDENMSSSLKPLAAFLWGEDQTDEQKHVKKLLKERGGWDKLTAEDTALYGAKDAELTLRLYLHQLDVIYQPAQPMLYGNPAPAVPRELLVQGLLLRIEDNGILVDQERLAKLLTEAESEALDIEETFLERYSVNVNSPKQVANLLFNVFGLKTKAGKVVPIPEPKQWVDKDGKPAFNKDGTPAMIKPKMPSVSRAVLESLEPHPELARILKQRRLHKAVSSYLKPLTEALCPDGRVHPTFWQHGTVTGRFSCSDPNLQTIPREDVLPGVRSLFIAADGYELWEYDLQAAEKRVLASLVEGDELKDLIESGADVHSLLAERVFGPGFTPLQRRYAKNIGYGFDYGLTSPVTAAKYIDAPKAGQLAKKILDGLRAMYPQVIRLMKTVQRTAERKGFIRTNEDHWPGRFRRFITESERKPFPYTALNARIQGSIAEAMKDYMLAAEPQLDAIGARICLQVHDSLVIEVPTGAGSVVKVLLQGIADQLDFFDCAMGFDGKPWGEHD